MMGSLAAVAAVAVIGLSAPVFAATTTDSVSGAADFRTAPAVGDGTYTDTIVTGESLWFAVRYENDTEVSFVATLTERSQDDSVTLTTDIVGPTLTSFDDLTTFTGRYDAGGVNTWFIRVNLMSSGVLGVEHDYELTLSGFEPPSEGAPSQGSEPRAEISRARAELSELRREERELADQLAELREQIERRGPSQAQVQQQVEQLEAELVSLDEQIATASAQTSIAPWAWVVAMLALASGGAVVLLAPRRRRAAETVPTGDRTPDEEDSVQGARTRTEEAPVAPGDRIDLPEQRPATIESGDRMPSGRDQPGPAQRPGGDQT